MLWGVWGVKTGSGINTKSPSVAAAKFAPYIRKELALACCIRGQADRTKAHGRKELCVNQALTLSIKWKVQYKRIRHGS